MIKPLRHPLVTHIVLSTIYLLVLWPTSASAALPAADKPDDPDFVHVRTVFPCTPRQTFAVAPGFTLTLADSTYGVGEVDGYSCAAWSETGPEAIYQLEVSATVVLFAALRDLDDRDLDLFLLQNCDNESCLIGANIEFTLRLDPGSYVLVVDGYGLPVPQAGDFTLLLKAREAGLPAAICESGGAEPVYCQVDSPIFSGDLFLAPDLLLSNECSTALESSGDEWFAVTVAAYHYFTATLTFVAADLDPALWLFPGCGDDAVCLDFVDAYLAGVGETLVWSNNSPADVTVYLGVDAFRPPAALGAGDFTLEIVCDAMVPAARTSLGSVKALFR